MVWRFLKKIGITPLYDPLLGIYTEEPKVEKFICIPLFIATLFTIAGKSTNTWRLSNTFLNNQQITEEIKREIKKISRNK